MHFFEFVTEISSNTVGLDHCVAIESFSGSSRQDQDPAWLCSSCASNYRKGCELNSHYQINLQIFIQLSIKSNFWLTMHLLSRKSWLQSVMNFRQSVAPAMAESIQMMQFTRVWVWVFNFLFFRYIRRISSNIWKWWLLLAF